MQDRRKLKRRHLIYYLRVFDRRSGDLLGHLVDLTTAGIMLISESPIPADHAYACRMVLPGQGDDQREVTFEAHSIWSKRDVNPAFYATGFRLERPDPEAVAAIEGLIAEYGFRD